MTKQVLFGKESRAKILEGVQKITKAVRVTMGANGKCVLIGNAVYGNDGMVQLPTIVSKDGWTVTQHFQLEDPIENRGAMLIREAATKTVEQAGDSTTATCVIAEALITGGMKLIDEQGANSQQLKKGMDKALEYVVDELKKMSTPVKGDIEKIRQIATVSANNDSAIGDLIAEAYSKIGDDGTIDIEQSKGVETSIKISDGFKFDKGWVSPLFINNKAKETCEFENPLILLYENRITHYTQIQKAVEVSSAEGRPLLIICEDADEQGLAFLAVNNIESRIRVCVVKSPDFGDKRRESMEDIAISTGGTYISATKGLDIKEVELQDFGQAKKVIVSKTETVIVGGYSDVDEVENFIADLKMNLVQAKDEDEKYPIEKRISRLTGGIAVIQVGAATETELHEKMYRVDDAVRATKAAISEGFVVGGGAAFLYCVKMLMASPHINENMQKALMAPIEQICVNAGVDADDKIVKIFEEQRKGNFNFGYNVLTDSIEDLVKAGIIDSTKALRCALTNAVSVAGMILTSECSITTLH